MSRSARALSCLNLLAAFPEVDVFRRSLDRKCWTWYTKSPLPAGLKSRRSVQASTLPVSLIRLKGDSPRYLILETKGFDELEEVKRAAAERWVAAVNAEGSHGTWRYAVVKKVSDVDDVIGRTVANQ